MSDGQTCGVVKCETSLPCNRLRRSCVSNAQSCGGNWWNVNFFWARATLCRDRAGRTSKHVAKCKFDGARRSPFARNEGQPSKTGVKLWFWKFNESQTAITVGKLRFFNVRCKRSRICVKLRLYPFFETSGTTVWREKKTCVKLRFNKVRRNPFTQNDCPTSKIAILQWRMQPFRTIWWSSVKNLRKISIFWSV